MQAVYAEEFAQIPAALAQNPPLAQRTVALIASEPTSGKVTEGAERLTALRNIMHELTRGRLTLDQAIGRARVDLPRSSSPYAASNTVFPRGWDERLIRTQLSRFYNHAVLDELLERGVERCFVPHSSAEAPESPCSRLLAGKDHDVRELRDLLVEAYSRGDWSSRKPKIPNHPHCTHVVRPL